MLKTYHIVEPLILENDFLNCSSPAYWIFIINLLIINSKIKRIINKHVHQHVTIHKLEKSSKLELMQKSIIFKNGIPNSKIHNKFNT